MSHLFDTDVKIAYSASMDEYSVACGYRTMKITDEFLVKGYYRNYDGMHLLKHALHNTCPDMMKSIGKDENGNDIKVRDSEGIQLANAKIDEIRRQDFSMLGRKNLQATSLNSYNFVKLHKDHWRSSPIRE